MNRIEFLQLLSSKSTNIEVTDIIVNFFDQYMIMFDLLSCVDQIFIVNADKSSISFQLLYNDPDEVERLVQHLSTIPIVNIYGSNYRIESSILNDYTIIITILN